MSHRLEPLLNPASIAVLGASERPGSVGRRTVENLLQGQYGGQLFAINPGYESVLGVPCYARISDIPGSVEHVIFTISDAVIEAMLGEVIEHGVAAVTIMSSLVLDGDPGLRDRISKKIQQSGLLVCGANGMGFYNLRDGVWACGFDTRSNHVKGGNVSLISHSGSGMSGLLDCEERIDFNLAISTGQELSVAMDEYIDYALDQPETRVIGLFMETVRNPEGLRAVLAKAAEQKVPVVAIKVGRTEFAARMTVTHSGAMAGQDAAFQALFDRYGVQRVHDMDSLAAALMLFAQPHPVGAGGLVAIHDSGGERQLLIDLADRYQVPLAEVSPATKQALANRLDPGLPAINPLDAWGAGGPDSDQIMSDCFSALLNDEQAAFGAVVHDRAPLSAIYPEYLEYIDAAHKVSQKPAVLVSNHQGSGSDPLAVGSTRRGFPVLDGLPVFLTALNRVFAYRDFQLRSAMRVLQAPANAAEKWRARLAGGATLDEVDSMELLADFELPVNRGSVVASEAELLSESQRYTYPVALKTAGAGMLHKTEAGGVVLNLGNEVKLLAAYRDMVGRLGERAQICPMILEPGVEMTLGVVRDEHFGPLVMLGFGGVHIEALDDVVYAIPPFDSATARRLLARLRLRPLLDSHRGMPAADIDAYCHAAAKLSVLASALSEVIEEIDINPVIVNQTGCIALDALIVGTTGTHENRRAG